jgi:hypothetical protein
MSAALRIASNRLPGRSVAAKVLLALVYVALAWLFGGTAGLVVGVVVVVSRWVFGLPGRWYWIGALAALAAAPVATIAQGLPGSSVVGPEFGEHHLAAHVLVGISLALAAFAGLLETERTHWRPPRGGGFASERQTRRAGAEMQADLRPPRAGAAAKAGYVVRLPWRGVRAVGRRARAVAPKRTPKPPAAATKPPVAPATPPVSPKPEPPKVTQPAASIKAPGFELPRPAPPGTPSATKSPDPPADPEPGIPGGSGTDPEPPPEQGRLLPPENPAPASDAPPAPDPGSAAGPGGASVVPANGNPPGTGQTGPRQASPRRARPRRPPRGRPPSSGTGGPPPP